MSETKKQTAAVPDSFANELIRARTKMGLSVSELHRQTTISRTVIQGYENGKFKPGTRELKLLCEALRISPNRLLFGTENPFQEKGKLAKLIENENDAQQVMRLSVLFQMLSSLEKEAFLTLMQSILEGRIGPSKIDEAFAVVDVLSDHIGDKVESVATSIENSFSEEDTQKMQRAMEQKVKRKRKTNPRKA